MAKWKIIVALVGIFAAGAVTGGLVALRVAKEMAERRGGPNVPAPWGPQQLRRLTERLQLSDEQVAKLRPILRRNMVDLNRLRAFTSAEMRRNFERLEYDIAAVLTPEQQAKYRELSQMMRRRLWQQQPNGMERGEDGPGRPLNRDGRQRQPGDQPPPKPPGN